MQWSGTPDDFGNRTLSATHTLHQHPLFTDAGLIRLLDLYPRDQIGLWTFPPHREGHLPPVRGDIGQTPSQDILEAVKNGFIWLNLRNSNHYLTEMKEIADLIFGSIRDTFNVKVLMPDASVLISSPNVSVNYHLDIPMVCLVHLRGEKHMWLYPSDEVHAPSEHIQNVILKKSEEELTFRKAYDASATKYILQPGDALTWPQSAPHRIQNGRDINVSLSCEYMTIETLLLANAMYTNGLMRTKLGLNPRRARKLNPSTLAKVAVARVAKTIRPPRSAQQVTPPTFRIDLDTETCTAPL